MDQILFHPNKAEDTGASIQTGKHLAQRTVNAFSGSHQWSMPLMASVLLGNKSIITLELFHYIFLHANVSYVDSLLPSKSNSSNDTSHDLVVFDKDSNEYAQSCLDAVMAAISKDENYNKSCGGTTLYKMADGTVVLLTQADSYHHCGPTLQIIHKWNPSALYNSKRNIIKND